MSYRRHKLLLRFYFSVAGGQMKLNTVVLLLALVLLLTFGSAGATNVLAANPNFSVTSILPPQEGEALFHQYFDIDGPFGKQNSRHSAKRFYWTPTAAEVSQAETSLAEYAQANNDVLDQSSVHLGLVSHDIVLTSDSRQYAGVTQGSERLILIKGSSFSSVSPNSFFMMSSQAMSEGRRTQSGHYSDGGSAFRAAYDLDACRIIFLDYDHLVERKQPQVLLQNLLQSSG